MRSPGEPAAPVRVEHLDAVQGEAQRGERGQHEIRVVPRPDGVARDPAVREVAGQAYARP